MLITAPFPGNVYGAFRIAQTIKRTQPAIVTVLGGGYCNTELRAHERAARLRLLRFRHARCRRTAAARPDRASAEQATARAAGAHLYARSCSTSTHKEPDIAFSDTGTPTYDGLPLDDYLSLLDMLNPMHRLWSDGRWNKLTVAHGCYWKKCSFCDVNLDYISRYDLAVPMC